MYTTILRLLQKLKHPRSRLPDRLPVVAGDYLIEELRTNWFPNFWPKVGIPDNIRIKTDESNTPWLIRRQYVYNQDSNKETHCYLILVDNLDYAGKNHVAYRIHVHEIIRNATREYCCTIEHCVGPYAVVDNAIVASVPQIDVTDVQGENVNLRIAYNLLVTLRDNYPILGF